MTRILDRRFFIPPIASNLARSRRLVNDQRRISRNKGEQMNSSSRENIITEFQRRRKRMLHNFGFCMILIALSLALLQLSDSYPILFGIGKNGWYALALAQFVAGVIFAITGFLQYRCPVCSEVIKGHDRYYLGVILDPDQCPHCRARLREPDMENSREQK